MMFGNSYPFAPIAHAGVAAPSPVVVAAPLDFYSAEQARALIAQGMYVGEAATVAVPTVEVAAPTEIFRLSVISRIDGSLAEAGIPTPTRAHVAAPTIWDRFPYDRR